MSKATKYAPVQTSGDDEGVATATATAITNDANQPTVLGSGSSEDDRYVATATAVLNPSEGMVPFDGISTNNDGIPTAKVINVQEEVQDEIVRVRVVAPSDLPTGYKLLVQTTNANGDDNNDDVFEIVVPEGGAHRGQEFIAHRHAPVPIEGRFSDDLCGCGSEGNWFFMAWCCNGLAFAAIMEKLGLNMCADTPSPIPRQQQQQQQQGRNQTRKQPNTYAFAAGMWALFWVTYMMKLIFNVTANTSGSTMAFYGLVVQVNFVIIIYLLVMRVKTRMAFRYQYRIPGDCCMDCLISYFCACCSALQMYRHMQHSGDRFKRFEDAVDAEIV